MMFFLYGIIFLKIVIIIKEYLKDNYKEDNLYKELISSVIINKDYYNNLMKWCIEIIWLEC